MDVANSTTLRRSRRTRTTRRRRKNNAVRPIVLPRFPPPLNLSSNIGTSWIRNYITVDQAASFIDNIGSEIFFSDTSFSSVYGEYKIHRVNVWFVPTSPTVSAGVYAFCCVDSGEVKTASDFKSISLMPGSSIRKIGSPSQGHWIPTEPSDREWHPFDNAWSIFCIRIAAAGNNKIVGYCVYDAHVSFRSTKAAVTERSAPNVSSPPHIPSLEDRILHLEELLSTSFQLV